MCPSSTPSVAIDIVAISSASAVATAPGLEREQVSSTAPRPRRPWLRRRSHFLWFGCSSGRVAVRRNQWSPAAPMAQQDQSRTLPEELLSPRSSLLGHVYLAVAQSTEARKGRRPTQRPMRQRRAGVARSSQGRRVRVAGGGGAAYRCRFPTGRRSGGRRGLPIRCPSERAPGGVEEHRQSRRRACRRDGHSMLVQSVRRCFARQRAKSEQDDRER
jgi:hypothetical protein